MTHSTFISRMRRLEKPCLVVAAGANHWLEDEIDGNVVRKAEMVTVDENEQAKVESGDILWAVGHGIITCNQVEAMGDIVVGRMKVVDTARGLGRKITR